MELLGRDGEFHSYDDMLGMSPAHIAQEIRPEKWQERYDACQVAIDQLGVAFRELNPDVVVVIGGDKKEQFLDDNMPTFCVYFGDRFSNIAPPFGSLGPGTKEGASGFWTDAPTDIPCEPSLGRHLVSSIVADNFDISWSRRQREGVGMGHAFTFVHRRIMGDAPIPVVPVMLNNYFPPNIPTTVRCLQFGRSLRAAIESWNSPKRVMIMASGGLSHFVVNEELDETVLGALVRNDEMALAAIPEKHLRAGNSEIKNWGTLAAALSDRSMRLVDYVPVYRTQASTGCAMGFALWT